MQPAVCTCPCPHVVGTSATLTSCSKKVKRLVSVVCMCRSAMYKHVTSFKRFKRMTSCAAAVLALQAVIAHPFNLGCLLTFLVGDPRIRRMWLQ